MHNTKIYYLETNALYSLANCLDLIAEKVEAYTSLFAIQEIVSQIKKETFFKRRGILIKLFSSKLKIIPNLPHEMIMAAFGLDISKTDQVIQEKNLWWTQAKLICSCSSYEEYCEKAKNLYGVDVEKNKKDEDCYDDTQKNNMQKIVEEGTQKVKVQRRRKREVCQKYGIQMLSELPQKHLIEGVDFVEIDVDQLILDEEDITKRDESMQDAKVILKKTLYDLGIMYDEMKLDILVQNRNREKLTAFMLGVTCYYFSEILEGKIPKRNDTIDLLHLIYLEDENYAIVSDDKIFDSSTIFQMRIKTGKLKTLCE